MQEKQTTTVSLHKKGINDFCVADRLLVTVSDDHSVLISELSEIGATPVHCLTNHQAPVSCIAHHPHSRLIATGGFDENVRVFNLDSAAMVAVLPAHADPVTSVAFSGGNGNLLASAAYDGLVRVWDARSGRVVRTMIGDTNPACSSVIFGAGEETVVAAYLDSCVRVWDVRNGTILRELKEHANRKYIIRPVMRNDEIIMGSEDGSMRIYGAANAHSHVQVYNDKQPVLNLAIAANGNLAVSNLENPVVKLISSY